jgi:predicted AlkP superfamily phosphohydrolase/phosphomutase
MNRRDFIRLAALSPAALLALQTGCFRPTRSGARRVIILGMDGMDPSLVRGFMASGDMPSMKRLAAMGSLGELGTSNPPQSPVAWSNFITGFGPEVHGIFDFIHRMPGSISPVLSTSRVVGPSSTVRIGKWSLPLSGAKVELLRKGEPFWKSITDDRIPVSLVKLPVEFPPETGRARILSGLGTPDMRGSQGSFTFFTDDARSVSDDTSGGIVVPVRDYGNGSYEIDIVGPENSMLPGAPKMKVKATVWADRTARSIRIDVDGRSHVLGQGEWSPWIGMRFEVIPGISSVSAMGRFFLKEIDPHLKLYLSPLNIDPENPALPLSNPPEWSRTLSERVGPFYTQGFPEDTKALSRGILTDEEYLQQAGIVLEERKKLFHHTFSEFDEGLFFFYFGSLDLNVHMFYRTMDSASPLYRTTDVQLFGNVIRDLYREMDSIIGKAMEMIDDRTVLMVMSDHGFAPFRRAFNLNSWLAAEGYASVSGSSYDRNRELFIATDWSTTSAYGLGLNCLYINERGREPDGIVPSTEKYSLLSRLKNDLEMAVDPSTGERIVREAFITSEMYHGVIPEYAPDMIIGYNRGMRSSWETTLGRYPEQVVLDNDDPWSGTHCVAPSIVPGTLASSRPVTLSNPELKDIGKSIASLLETTRLPAGGRNIFGDDV